MPERWLHAQAGKDARDQSSRGNIMAADDEIAFESAMVVTPADATLVKDLTLRVPAGTNLLVTGPNGSGKSSLFRVLGGLWPLTAGIVSPRSFDSEIYPVGLQEKGHAAADLPAASCVMLVNFRYCKFVL
jgi:ABC-type uncharacterized transport system fused permease/ATPase subunit